MTVLHVIHHALHVTGLLLMIVLLAKMVFLLLQKLLLLDIMQDLLLEQLLLKESKQELAEHAILITLYQQVQLVTIASHAHQTVSHVYKVFAYNVLQI